MHYPKIEVESPFGGTTWREMTEEEYSNQLDWYRNYMMKNQNASAEYPHIPAKGSLQTALPMAALRSLPPLQWRQSMESPCVDGRSSFFQIAAFLLREGGGVSPSTLECRLI